MWGPLFLGFLALQVTGAMSYDLLDVAESHLALAGEASADIQGLGFNGMFTLSVPYETTEKAGGTSIIVDMRTPVQAMVDSTRPLPGG